MIKLKSRHFDTAEVMKAESQVVLNHFTEHEFQMQLKMPEAQGMVHMRGRGLLRG
jgi:hypothetical protein